MSVLRSACATEALDCWRPHAAMKGNLHSKVCKLPEIVALLDASVFHGKSGEFCLLPLSNHSGQSGAVGAASLENFEQSGSVGVVPRHGCTCRNCGPLHAVWGGSEKRRRDEPADMDARARVDARQANRQTDRTLQR